MPTLVKKWLARPILRFAGVGLSSTLLDIAALNLLRNAGMGIYLATALGFLVGVTNGYLLNSLLVFGTQHSYASYFKYFVISAAGLLYTEAIVNFLYVHHSFSLNAAKLVAVAIVFFWNYGMSRAWAFRQKVLDDQ